MPLTQDLGRFASGLTFENLPREAVEIARTGFIDTIATMIAGANDPAPQLLRRGLAPASRGGTGQPVFLRRERRRAGSGLDQRHRGPCARLRRCRLPRPPLDGAGAGDPRRGRDAGARRARDVRGLCRRLRDLGRAGASRPRPPSRQGLAPDRHFRRDRSGRRLRRAAPSRSEPGDHGDRAVGLAGRRHHGQFRHDDEAVPRRTRVACRAGLGPPRRTRASRPPPTRSNTRRASCRRCRPRGAPTATARPGPAGNGRSSSRVSASRNTRPATAPTGRSTRCSTCSRSGP